MRGEWWRVVAGALALAASGCGRAATSKDADRNAAPDAPGSSSDATPAPSNAERLPAGFIDKLVAEAPNAERAELAGAGHFTNLEAPREFNRILLDFFRRVDGN